MAVTCGDLGISDGLRRYDSYPLGGDHNFEANLFIGDHPMRHWILACAALSLCACASTNSTKSGEVVAGNKPVCHYTTVDVGEILVESVCERPGENRPAQ